MTNDHGWRLIGTGIADMDGQATTSGPVYFALAIDERKRCGCPKVPCQRFATQEDLLCDECRETCQ